MYWNKHILITDIDNKYGLRAIFYEFLWKKTKKKPRQIVAGISPKLTIISTFIYKL